MEATAHVGGTPVPLPSPAFQTPNNAVGRGKRREGEVSAAFMQSSEGKTEEVKV